VLPTVIFSRLLNDIKTLRDSSGAGCGCSSSTIRHFYICPFVLSDRTGCNQPYKSTKLHRARIHQIIQVLMQLQHHHQCSPPRHSLLKRALFKTSVFSLHRSYFTTTISSDSTTLWTNYTRSTSSLWRLDVLMDIDTSLFSNLGPVIDVLDYNRCLNPSQGFICALESRC
jgi:hypothetical protein